MEHTELALVSARPQRSELATIACRAYQVEHLLRDLSVEMKSSVLRQAARNMGLADGGKSGADA